MGTKRNVDMSATEDTVKKVEAVEASPDHQDSAESDVQAQLQGPAKKHVRDRSKKYIATRAHVDKTKSYDPFAAVELVKRLSYSSFDGTISADGVVKEEGEVTSFTYPHTTGKTRKIVIVDDAVLKEIESGSFEADVLLSTPQYMSKLAKHAPVLGPKGLMPNPKSGTLTENPEAKKKELEAGKLTLKTQRKMPVFHTVIGKTNMETKDLVENIMALVAATDKKLKKLSISATMSPGVRVDLHAAREQIGK